LHGMQEVVGSTPILSTRLILRLQDFLFMAFYVYILHSLSLDQYYVGHTGDLEDRIFRHTNSGSKSTKKANDWEIKYTEEFATRQEAVKRELEIKKKKSRKYIEWLISSVG
jgi:putative endonuclease